GAEDVVDAVRAILVSQIELLREPHVREHEDHVATLLSAQDSHVVGEIPFGPRERDAARVGGRLSDWCERIVVADKADADAAAIEDLVGRKDRRRVGRAGVEHAGPDSERTRRHVDLRKASPEASALIPEDEELI